jgi:hypothetical protein
MDATSSPPRAGVDAVAAGGGGPAEERQPVDARRQAENATTRSNLHVLAKKGLDQPTSWLVSRFTKITCF